MSITTVVFRPLLQDIIFTILSNLDFQVGEEVSPDQVRRLLERKTEVFPSLIFLSSDLSPFYTLCCVIVKSVDGTPPSTPPLGIKHEPDCL